MAKQILPQAEAPIIDAAGFTVGRVPTTADTASKPPNFGARSLAFRLSHHSTSWELFETSKGWRLLPVLNRLTLKPGVNWTKNANGRAPDASDLEAKARSRWGQVVLTDWPQYIRLHNGADGSTGYFLAWERLRIYEDGAWEAKTDEDGYALWRWSLVVAGILAPPRESIISEIRHRLNKARQRATRTPHLMQAQQALKKAEARLEGLTEALNAIAELRGGKPTSTHAAAAMTVPTDSAELDELRAMLKAQAATLARLEAEGERLRMEGEELRAQLADQAEPTPKKPARTRAKRAADTSADEESDDG